MNIDMSLEDMIKSKKGRGGGSRGGNTNRSTARGGVGARRGGRDFAAPRPRSTPYSTQRPHRAGGAAASAAEPTNVISGGVETISKIAVSNLAPTVTEHDVMELFKQIGRVTKANLNYDGNGKSKGSATVVFARKSDATKAVAEYHNRTFDGRPMVIEVVVSSDAVNQPTFASRLGQPSPNRPRNGAAPRGSSRGGSRGGFRGGRGGSRGGSRSDRGAGGAPKTDDEKRQLASKLDSEMDNYMKQ